MSCSHEIISLTYNKENRVGSVLTEALWLMLYPETVTSLCDKTASFKSPDEKVRVVFGRWKRHSLAIAQGAPFPQEEIRGDQVPDSSFCSHSWGWGGRTCLNL